MNRQHIAGTSGDAPRRHTLCDTPPLDARPGAALITAAARILDDGDLRVLGEFLAVVRADASRKSPRGRWIRSYQRSGHDCSGGFRAALEPLINSFQRTDRRSRGRRAPAPQVKAVTAVFTARYSAVASGRLSFPAARRRATGAVAVSPASGAH